MHRDALTANINGSASNVRRKVIELDNAGGRQDIECMEIGFCCATNSEFEARYEAGGSVDEGVYTTRTPEPSMRLLLEACVMEKTHA
jgi:hypothetical protein